jgi:hypothetical protein
MNRTDLGARHAELTVGLRRDVRRLERLGEARPPGARIVFVEGAEQGLAAHDVDVNAGFVIAPILVAKCGLGGLVLRDLVLQ